MAFVFTVVVGISVGCICNVYDSLEEVRAQLPRLLELAAPLTKGGS